VGSREGASEPSGYITGRIFFTSLATVSFSNRTQLLRVSYFLLPTMFLPRLQFHYHVFGPWPVPVSEVLTSSSRSYNNLLYIFLICIKGPGFFTRKFHNYLYSLSVSSFAIIIILKVNLNHFSLFCILICKKKQASAYPCSLCACPHGCF